MVAHVEINTDSVRQAWLDPNSDEFWVEVCTTNANDEQFFGVIAELNEVVEGPLGAFAGFPTRSPQGYVTALDGIVDEEHLAHWCGLLASRLAALGIDGTIRSTVAAEYPEFVSRGMQLTELSAFIAWNIPADLAARRDPKGWNMSVSATDDICEHIAGWVAPGGPEVILRRGVFRFRLTDRDEIASALASATVGEAQAGVLRFDGSEQRARHGACFSGNQSVLQGLRDPLPWYERVDALRDAITALPHLTTLAFLRPTANLAGAWNQVAARQPLPEITEADIRYNKHLLASNVPDAHGIQVLCDEHLVNASDLSMWTITNLGHGRHLVEAPDLAPWYSEDLPDPDVLAQARRDFGDMLLTEAVIEAHPPPWRGTPPAR